MKKARFWGLLAMAMLLVVSASCVEPDYPPPAPEGAPLTVRAYAVGEHDIYVAGVEITVTDAEGESQTNITTENYIYFEMLAGYNYTITATFNGSTESTQAVIQGFLAPGQDVGSGGAISVFVWQSNDTIRDVYYSEPLLC